MNLRALILEQQGRAALANAAWQPYEFDEKRLVREGNALLRQAAKLREQDTATLEACADVEGT